MCPSPRTINDSAIFAATLEAAGESGPTKLTLAHVAKKVGMSPATLIQRFGTKRGLLLAALRQGGGSTVDPFRGARAQHASPPDALVGELSESLSVLAVLPDAFAHHLCFLQMDRTELDFYEITLGA